VLLSRGDARKHVALPMRMECPQEKGILYTMETTWERTKERD